MTTFSNWAFLPNIASVRALGGLTLCDQAADVINVIGYYSPSVTSTPDGGGGIFVYNPDDTTNPDDGGIIIVDTVGRRWYRQFSGSQINVKWFGAKGDSDGSSGNGTDDTAAIQAAIYYADRAFDGLNFPVVGTLISVYFPAGIYRITDTLNTTRLTGQITRGSINWQGDGKDDGFYHRSILMFDHSQTVCINVDPQFAASAYASIKNMVFTAIQQAVLQHCFSFVSGSNFIEGVMERVTFGQFTGCAIWFPLGSTAYMQQVRFDDISMNNIGGMIGSDPSFHDGLCNVCLIRNCNLDNAVNLAVATQPAFFNLYAFNEVQMEQIIYEGTGSTPAIIRYGGNQYFKLRGFHMEIQPPFPTNFIELMATITGGGQVIDIESVVCENALNGKIVKFNGRANTIVRISDYASGESHPQISDITDFSGAGVGNHVEVNAFATNLVPYVSTAEIAQISFNNIRTLIGGNTFISDSAVFPYVTERGAWLDSLNDGIVSISTAGASIALTNIGMFTDADEGRCFELVAANDDYPKIIITVTPPAALVGQQMTFAIRFYLDSGQTPFDYTALLPNVASEAHHEPTDVVQNAWNTEVCYCTVPNTTPFTVASSTQDLIAPTGIKKLRIAAIYVAAGTEVPVTLIGGALATKAIEWTAAAAPTYGDYIVGDKVNNSVPAVGQPLGWVCTVAGSPGTWVALANL